MVPPMTDFLPWRWNKKRKNHTSIMLVTDIPPATNYSGGIFINEILKSVDFAVVDVFVLLNRFLNPHIPPDVRNRLNLHICTKPIEQYFPNEDPQHSPAWIHRQEIQNVGELENILASSLLPFAKKCGTSQFWVLLEGQSMIRIAYNLLAMTQVPVHVQVLDPPASWLRAHGLDDVSIEEVSGKFHEVMQRARSCAAASWVMAETYKARYGLKTVPVMPSLPGCLARPPASPNSNEQTIKIGVAGQIYARKEWDALLTCLDSLHWQVGNRQVEIHAHAQNVPEVTSQHKSKIQFHPWQITKDLIRALSKYDLMYCAYSFDSSFREDAELCFPSKISTYLAAGRPVFFHGPSYASPSRFLTEQRAGIVCNSFDPDDLGRNLCRALTDNALYETVAQNGRRAFDRYFTRQQLQRSTLDFLGVQFPSQ